ncbi:hypothetical protein [Streptomyces alboflavus]|uniref:hypothetical protein n=1 Tax=Streptomyces alboflavus TaxID=67267 RepID=UPI000F657B1E|nr:hypothetical protein [Streptomyces alboflavus]
MHIRKAGIVTAGALAAILVPIAASPASAADGQVSCSTTGGSGGASWTWSSKTKLSSIWLNVYDSKADGAHPAIRLVTVQNNGNVKLWKYRHMTSGAGETGNWNTSATDGYGIKRASIEVTIFDGDRELHTCGAGSIPNPHY